MTQIVLQGYVSVIVCFVGITISACPRVYPDLCGYNGNENGTEFEDYNEDSKCGECSAPLDCQQVTFCSLFKLSEECNSATVLLKTNDNTTCATQLNCDISPLESQVNTPVCKISDESENQCSVKISTEFDIGRYKIVCDILQNTDDVTVTNGTQLDIVSVDPAEVVVDSEMKLQLTVTSDTQRNLTIWCFVKTPDGDLQILPSSWVSESGVVCTGFNPGIPGVYSISLSSFMTPDIFEKGITVRVTSKHPVAEKAKYHYDFKSIFVYFNENIDLRSTCGSVFTGDSLENFGVGFDCYTRGNVLVVKMGPHFKIIDNIEINGGGRICRAGLQNAESCLLATTVNLRILKPKFSGPILSFYLNASCSGDVSQKYMNIKALPSGGTPNFSFQNPIAPLKNSGKRQRKNLIIWRTMRQFQSRLSSRHITLNTTNVRTVFENLQLAENVLDMDGNLVSKASVSVFLQSSPVISSVLAEADVRFCDDVVHLFRYEWTINGRRLFEVGRFLILRDLPPGKYVIKCMVVDSNSTEILGQGWATTEISTTDERIVIVPSEMTVGTPDIVYLSAITWHDSTVSWTCRTNGNDSCFTEDKKPIKDVINLNSPSILIPPGTLPAGIYKWVVESVGASYEAKVFIRNGNVPTVKVNGPSLIVKPSQQEVAVRGIVERMQRGCRAWWSSIRQKGFDYFDLNTIGVNYSVIERFPRKEIPLVIPSNSEIWTRVEPSSLYLFQLQVFCPYNSYNERGSFEYLKIPLIVSKPPSVPPVNVQPLAGEAMITPFEISGAEADASVDDYPLIYEWSYVDSCNVEVPIARGASPRNFTTYLPPGDLKLSLKVCNGKKTCSSSSTPSINVIQSSDFPADNIRNAGTQIQSLMTRGDTLEALGLATTVFKSLALLAEAEVREEILTTVEESIKNKIKELFERVRSDPRVLNSCLEFFERAVTVAKYFRKGSDVLNRLMEFRESVLKNGGH